MTKEGLALRTKTIALRVIKFCKSINADEIDKIILKQLVRSATSVAANYRAALKAKSYKDFAYKINVIEEEADESYFWLELITETGCVSINKTSLLIKEADELTAIFTAQGKTVKQKRNSKQ